MRTNFLLDQSTTVNGKGTSPSNAGACETFQHRLCHLSKRCRSGSWNFGDKMRFCGAEVSQSSDLEQVTVSLKGYASKIKPLIMEKSLKTMSDDFCTEKKHLQLRASVGAMSRSVMQRLPQAAATISILQAHINKPAIKDMLPSLYEKDCEELRVHFAEAWRENTCSPAPRKSSTCSSNAPSTVHQVLFRSNCKNSGSSTVAGRTERYKQRSSGW